MAKKQKFLIVVGLPKSGTTFLYAQSAKRPDVFAMPVGVKEVDYFRRGDDLGTYLNFFEPAEGKTVFDASPLYLDDVERSTRNIKAALEGHDVKIIVCLREPLERAYSHYLHDVATNHKLVGHADYSFWSPPVLAKYLYLIEPRIAFLQSEFGAENVHPFMFGQDMSAFEQMLREFVGLEEGWSLDLTSNPAPGFTAPQSFYNETLDSEVHLGRDRYLLRKGRLLVVNRQYSLLRSEIHPDIANQVVMRQATLTRQFDTGLLSEDTREQILSDTEAAASQMGLALSLDRTPKVLRSKLSQDLPDHIRGKLAPLGTADDGFRHVLSSGMRATSKVVVTAPDEVPSLARDMKRAELAFWKDPIVSETFDEVREDIVEKFGPVSFYISGLLYAHIVRREYDQALALFEPYGGPRHLLWPPDLAWFLESRNIELPDEVRNRFEQAGIRTSK